MKSPTASSSEIRAWARKAGLAVGDRGRLSPAVLDAYNDAHGGARAMATKAPAKKAPAKKAAAKKATKAPVRKNPPRTVQHEAKPVEVAAPVIAADSELLQGLEDQITKLAARVERLEAARAATAAVQPKAGLFGRKKN